MCDKDTSTNAYQETAKESTRNYIGIGSSRSNRNHPALSTLYIQRDNLIDRLLEIQTAIKAVQNTL